MYDNLYFDNDIVRRAKEISEQYSDIFRQLSDILRFQNTAVPKFCIEPKLVDRMGSYINNSISTQVAQIQISYAELIKSRIVLPDLTRQIHELKAGIIAANYRHLKSVYSAISMITTLILASITPISIMYPSMIKPSHLTLIGNKRTGKVS